MSDGFDRLLSFLRNSGKGYDVDLIIKAYDYAKTCHAGQVRLSGEEYITHPVAVAEIVATMELDSASICAALLHDTIEDCHEKATLENIRQLFGNDVSDLVDGLTKLYEIRFETKDDENIENLRKMFLAMSRDIRVIFIKLCDRLHNMRTLSSKPESKQRIIALETMHVYAPLSHRLGIQKIKQELEDLALQYLDPIGYNEVRNNIEEKFGEKRDFLESNLNRIKEKIGEHTKNFAIEGRVKSIYSIYKKMYNHNKSFDEIYDFYAIRIIVNTETDCYMALGMIHEMFNYMPGRFKDYISMPKANLYRSLHTTVIGKDGIPFEIQIRTWEMHTIAEYGIAAHWKYKDKVHAGEELTNKLQWIRTLLETEKNTDDPEEFLRPLKIDLFEDETFVYTPKGDVINLPNGSTIIDFAYAIHSAVGNKIIGAKVNGMIAPIDQNVQNGQIIEILTSNSSKGPSRDWLKIVKTSEARNKIRQWFKKEQRPENIKLGKEAIDEGFKRLGRAVTEQLKEEILLNIAKRASFFDLDDLYNSIGYGGVAATKITSKIRDEYDRLFKVTDEEITDVSMIQTKEIKRGTSTMVLVDGIDNCQVKFAKCCNPLPGDRISGFITKGYGISVHKQDCPNMVAYASGEEYKDRVVRVSWLGQGNVSEDKKHFEALLQVFARNDVRLLADIASTLADMKVSIHSINSRMKHSGDVILNLTVSAKDVDHLNYIVSRLKGVKGVVDIGRGFS
ncbi:MAG: bifunctional (p)ppGpp synthetase/guanosine-3',5'-bis(diphosphate) 3'-pyrophosphohydrolase [Eubacteriales bacterium]